MSVPGGAEITHRRLDIQGLRGVAVLAVVLFHSGFPLAGGFLGVDVFFVISGFVISGIISRIAPGRIRHGLTQFYIKRLRRLLPALAVLLVFVVILSALLQGTLGAQQNTGYTGLGAIFMSANLVLTKLTHGYFTATAESNPLLHTWSLSVEEQFYLVFPFLFIVAALLGARRGTARAYQIAFAIFMTAVSLAFALAFAAGAWSTLNRFVGEYYSPVTRAWEFGFGVLAFLLAPSWSRVSPLWARLFRIAGTLIMLAGFILITENLTTPGPSTLVPVIGAFIVLAFPPLPKAKQPWFGLSFPVLVRLGDLSYSWYLWHWPLIVFAVLLWPENVWVPAIAVVVALAPAWLSLVFVEAPIRWRWKPSRANLVLGVSGMIAIPAVLSGALIFFSSHSYFTPKVSTMAAATNPLHAAQRAGCADVTIPAGDYFAACTWNAAASGAPIYLVGDSRADQISEALIAAASDVGRPIRLETSDGCPFVPLRMSRPELGAEWEHQCFNHTEGTLTWLANQPPGLVIISNSAEYVVSPKIGLTSASGEVEYGDSTAKASLFLDGLDREIGVLQSHGNSVLIVTPTPAFAHEDWPRTCTVADIVATNCLVQARVSELPSAVGIFNQAMEKRATSLGARVANLTPIICPAGLCSTSQGTMFYYRDAEHISVDLSESLGAFFVPLLKP